jgi:hypothetical protein
MRMRLPNVPRLAALYKGFAVLLLNTLVLLAAAGLAVALWLAYGPRAGRSPLERQGDRLLVLYPGKSRTEVAALLEETYLRYFEYEPFTGFKERAYHGRYVRVDEAGFRHGKDQGPWPPSLENLNVFVFGGSTAFGYGVADDETVGSFLQEALAGRAARPPRVYNFARGAYYSSQERALFLQLLIAGHTPDVAIFIDGLNEFHTLGEAPLYTATLRTFMDQYAAIRESPFAWLYAPFRAFRRGGSDPAPSTDPALADRLIVRYERNKKIIESSSAAFGVPAVFVWQPMSVYRYDTRRHPLWGEVKGQPLPGIGSMRMAERRQAHPFGREFVWAADIQDAVPDPLYVGGVHYAPNLCRALARFIADALVARGFVGPGTEREAGVSGRTGRRTADRRAQ